jgi:hypothetical protein
MEKQDDLGMRRSRSLALTRFMGAAFVRKAHSH